MEAKKRLVEEIVRQYHGQGTGTEERRRFEELFSKKATPDDLPSLKVALDSEGKINLVSLIVEQSFAKSRSEARRLIQQKAVKLDGNTIGEDSIAASPGSEPVLRVGKLHLVKLVLE